MTNSIPTGYYVIAHKGDVPSFTPVVVHSSGREFYLADVATPEQATGRVTQQYGAVEFKGYSVTLDDGWGIRTMELPV